MPRPQYITRKTFLTDFQSVSESQQQAERSLAQGESVREFQITVKIL